MMWIILFIGFFILLLLILRFVYPDLIYSLRQASVEVEMGRALLDFDANLPLASARLNRAQIKDIRFETGFHDESYIRSRISDIKKLYHLLNPRKKAVPGISDEMRKPQLCLIELANLLSHYGKITIPDSDYVYRLCVSEEILTLIANNIQEKENKTTRITKDDVQKWYEKNPISVEQAIEMTSAVIYALSYRQTAQYNSKIK